MYQSEEDKQLKTTQGKFVLEQSWLLGLEWENLVLFLGDSLELLFDLMEVTKTFENVGYYMFCCRGEIFRHENKDEHVTRIQAEVCRLRANSLLSGSSWWWAALSLGCMQDNLLHLCWRQDNHGLEKLSIYWMCQPEQTRLSCLKVPGDSWSGIVFQITYNTHLQDQTLQNKLCFFIE